MRRGNGYSCQISSGESSLRQARAFIRLTFKGHPYRRGMNMDRNNRALLSWHEFASLRRLRSNSRQQISSRHRQLLLSMGLVADVRDELNLTETGLTRLGIEDRSACREE